MKKGSYEKESLLDTFKSGLAFLVVYPIVLLWDLGTKFGLIEKKRWI